MDFYFDSGYGSLMADKTNLTCVPNEVYSPYSGAAFTGTECDVTFKVPLDGMNGRPDVLGDTSKIYSMSLKFSVYCTNMTPINSDSYQPNYFLAVFSKSTTASYATYCGVRLGKIICDACTIKQDSKGVIEFHEFSEYGDLSESLHNISLTLAYRYYTESNQNKRAGSFFSILMVIFIVCRSALP